MGSMVLCSIAASIAPSSWLLTSSAPSTSEKPQSSTPHETKTNKQLTVLRLSLGVIKDISRYAGAMLTVQSNAHLELLTSAGKKRSSPGENQQLRKQPQNKTFTYQHVHFEHIYS